MASSELRLELEAEEDLAEAVVETEEDSEELEAGEDLAEAMVETEEDSEEEVLVAAEVEDKSTSTEPAMDNATM